jgi:tRNA(Ile)-lysidine synthase
MNAAEKIAEFIGKHQLLNEKDRLLLALSGGRDSVVLFHILIALKIPFSVAHCNFSLRGKESDEDEIFVKNLCRAHQIECLSITFATNEFAEKNHLNIQLAARKLRYDWFFSLPFEKIAVAHHASDNAETLLINQLRGTGLNGMCGIPAKNGKIIRPMLALFSHEVQAYAEEKSFSWREDSSNQKTDYRRNFLRKKIFPLFKQIQPETEKIFWQNSRKISAAADFNEHFIRETLLRHVHSENDFFRFDFLAVEHLPGAVYLLYKFLQIAGFSFSECENIWEKRHIAGKKWFSKDFVLFSHQNSLVLAKNTENEKIDFIIEENNGEKLFSENKKLSWALTNKLSPEEKAENSGFSAAVAVLDAEKLTFPLRVRNVQAGDRFRPSGMRGKSKSVAVFLKDKKIPELLKKNILVMLSEDEIVWLVNFRVAENFCAKENSQKIITFAFSEIN